MLKIPQFFNETWGSVIVFSNFIYIFYLRILIVIGRWKMKKIEWGGRSSEKICTPVDVPNPHWINLPDIRCHLLIFRILDGCGTAERFPLRDGSSLERHQIEDSRTFVPSTWSQRKCIGCKYLLVTFMAAVTWYSRREIGYFWAQRTTSKQCTMKDVLFKHPGMRKGDNACWNQELWLDGGKESAERVFVVPLVQIFRVLKSKKFWSKPRVSAALISLVLIILLHFV